LMIDGRVGGEQKAATFKGVSAAQDIHNDVPSVLLCH